jgi:cytochrome c peroxidase
MKAMNKTLYLLLLLVVLSYACEQDSLPDPLDTRLERRLAELSPDGTLDHFRLPNSQTELSKVPAGVANPLTPEKIALGKMLFFETGLAADAMHESGKGTYSCGTCHVPSAGFMPGSKQGIADGGVGFGANGESRGRQIGYDETELDVQGARPLSMLNTAFVTNTTWSGKFGANHANEGTEHAWVADAEINEMGLDGLESQIIEGLALHRMRTTAGWLDTLGYTDMYDAAFADFPETERYTALTSSFAISAYLRSLTTTEAPFQRWVRGEQEAMSRLEKEGALVFFTKAGCYRCHKGAALSSTEFHALGVRDLYESGAFNTGPNDIRNFGRGGFTGLEEDLYKFKVPQLYNLKDSPFYFHGSSRHSLRAVVEYFNKAEAENANVPQGQLSPYFHPLQLTEDEKAALVAFLEHSLYDPDWERFVPSEVLSGNCFPNNDPLSQEQLGCQ